MFRRNFILTSLAGIVCPWWVKPKKTCPVCGIRLPFKKATRGVWDVGASMAKYHHLTLCHLSPDERKRHLESMRDVENALVKHIREEDLAKKLKKQHLQSS